MKAHRVRIFMLQLLLVFLVTIFLSLLLISQSDPQILEWLPEVPQAPIMFMPNNSITFISTELIQENYLNNDTATIIDTQNNANTTVMEFFDPFSYYINEIIPFESIDIDFLLETYYYPNVNASTLAIALQSMSVLQKNNSNSKTDSNGPSKKSRQSKHRNIRGRKPIIHNGAHYPRGIHGDWFEYFEKYSDYSWKFDPKLHLYVMITVIPSNLNRFINSYNICKNMRDNGISCQLFVGFDATMFNYNHKSNSNNSDGDSDDDDSDMRDIICDKFSLKLKWLENEYCRKTAASIGKIANVISKIMTYKYAMKNVFKLSNLS